MLPSEKNLWIDLTAEHIQWFQKRVNKQDTDLETCREIATNQYNAQSKNSNLRYTLEDLLTKSHEELLAVSRQWHKNFVRKNFGGPK